ncbi:MAG: tyrosine-type recombinase/integrase [Stellaceae bacterium]
MSKITKRVVDALKPDKTRELFVWDSELRGFGVRIMPKPSGVGSFFIQYRSPEGRTRRFTIGRLGTLAPDQARDLAADKLRDVAKGRDPSAERRRLREGITVAELCDLYLEDAEGRVKASTLAMDKSRINVHVKPLLGRRSVASLTSADIERMQAAIARGKTARAPKRDDKGRRKGRGGVAAGGRSVAARTVGMLHTVLEYARRSKHITENPAHGVPKFEEGRQRRYLTIEEIAALGDAMRQAGAVGESATGLAAIRLLLMTGLRRMEALALPREWIDRRARCIRFGDTKTGAQLRPIGAAAIGLIDDQAEREGCRYLFPAVHGDSHLVGVPRILARLCEAAGLEGVTVHVLRHSFGSVAAEMGYSELTIAGLLGHAVRGVTGRYAHVPDAALLAAADRVAARIRGALDGETGAAEVVELETARAPVRA